MVKQVKEWVVAFVFTRGQCAIAILKKNVIYVFAMHEIKIK